jgi:hypothetical protein
MRLSEPNRGDDDRCCRALAAAEIAAFALERDLAHMALAGAQEAARSALLALAGAPRRHAAAGGGGRGDLDLLRRLAAASPQDLAAGRPGERDTLVRAALAATRRLLPRPGAEAPPQPAPAAACGSGQTARAGRAQMPA